MKGFLNIYKPSDMSSAYALNLIKKRFKGLKLGHMGTLDPLATGVLPVAFGKATRLFDYLLDKEKIYKAHFTFGYETDTLDRGGKVILTGGKCVNESDISKVLNSLVGEVYQIPPKFSAKNVNGMRGYDLARQGIDFELKPKKVTINSITLDGKINENTFSFTIVCRGGTYIRSICRDLAYKLNTFATMTMLERVKSGAFTKENSHPIEEILNCNDISKFIIPPKDVIDFTEITLTDKQTDDVLNGRRFRLNVSNGVYKILSKNDFIGVGEITDGQLKIKAYIKD